MVTMYKTETGTNIQLTKVNVDKYTHKSVWVNGVKYDMAGIVVNYHHSLSQATNLILNVCKSRLEQAQKNMKQANEILKKLNK